MFTGLVQAMGEVLRVGPTPTGVRLEIQPLGWDYRPALGDSIAVSGVCLTIAGLRTSGARRVWAFDVVQQTLKLTSLGALRVGSRVNLEHALLPTTLLGGHLVQGHVDGLGEVVGVQTGEDWRVRIRPRDAGFMEYVVPQGSVCIDGVSLTIAGVWKKGRARGLEVALIPTTLAKTTLASLDAGDLVNLEADVIAKTVVHTMKRFMGRQQTGDGPRLRRRTKRVSARGKRS